MERDQLLVKWLPIKGIQNVSQTCYFNSTLQLLSACNSLVSKLYNVHPTPDMGCIIEITSIWLKWLNHPSPLYIELEKQRIVRLMGQLGSPMIYGAQEDAHECLLNLFRLITNDLALSNDTKDKSILSESIEVVSRKKKTCSYCKLQGDLQVSRQQMLDVTVNDQENLQAAITRSINTSSSIECPCGMGMFFEQLRILFVSTH